MRFAKMLDFNYAKQMRRKLQAPLWDPPNSLKLNIVFDYPVDIRFSLPSCKNVKVFSLLLSKLYT